MQNLSFVFINLLNSFLYLSKSVRSNSQLYGLSSGQLRHSGLPKVIYNGNVPVTTRCYVSSESNLFEVGLIDVLFRLVILSAQISNQYVVFAIKENVIVGDDGDVLEADCRDANCR